MSLYEGDKRAAYIGLVVTAALLFIMSFTISGLFLPRFVNGLGCGSWDISGRFTPYRARNGDLSTIRLEQSSRKNGNFRRCIRGPHLPDRRRSVSFLDGPFRLKHKGFCSIQATRTNEAQTTLACPGHDDYDVVRATFLSGLAFFVLFGYRSSATQLRP